MSPSSSWPSLTPALGRCTRNNYQPNRSGNLPQRPEQCLVYDSIHRYSGFHQCQGEGGAHFSLSRKGMGPVTSSLVLKLVDGDITALQMETIPMAGRSPGVLAFVMILPFTGLYRSWVTPTRWEALPSPIYR